MTTTYFFAIGVADYDDERLNLKDAGTSVEQLTAYVRDYWPDAKLQDRVERARSHWDRAAVQNVLKTELGKVGPNDVAIVYWVGHASRTEGSHQLLLSLASGAEGRDGDDPDVSAGDVGEPAETLGSGADRSASAAGAEHADDLVEVFADAAAVGGGGRRAAPIRLASPAPLASALSLTRALRPFRQAKRPGREVVLDVEETIRATVEARGDLQPTFRRRSEPRFAAHLVVDESPSMAAWADSMERLELVFRQSSSFRSVNRWLLATAGDEVSLVTPQGRATSPPWLGVEDDSVVVLATDGRGPLWRDEHWWAE